MGLLIPVIAEMGTSGYLLASNDILRKRIWYKGIEDVGGQREGTNDLFS